MGGSNPEFWIGKLLLSIHCQFAKLRCNRGCNPASYARSPCRLETQVSVNRRTGLTEMLSAQPLSGFIYLYLADLAELAKYLLPACFSIEAMLLYICSLNNLENMTSAIEVVKPAIQDGIEFYTSADGKLSGVSQVGCSRLCGVSETTMRRIINDLSVRQITPSSSLEHLVGKDCCLAISSSQQAKVLDSKVVASLITYYAVEKGSKVALHSMAKFVSIGIDTWIQKITGYSEPNGTLELLNSINSTMGKLLVKIERLEEIETETMGYRKATVTLPVLQKWTEKLSKNEKQRLLEPGEELLTIKEAMASLHPGCVFSQTLHKKLALKVGQTITALSDKPNVKKLTPNGKGFNMAVNGYTRAQLPLIKLCLQSIMGEC